MLGIYATNVRALGRTILEVRLGPGPYGPTIFIRYEDPDGQIHEWDMAALAGGSPEYEDPDSIATTIVINFLEP